MRNIGVALALQILLISSWCHADVRVNKVEADLQTIRTALSLFKLDVGRYPTRREGIGTLVYSKKSAKLENYPVGGYLTRQPDDSWGNPYHYYVYRTKDGSEIVHLWSYGADGRPGGEGNDVDKHVYLD